MQKRGTELPDVVTKRLENAEYEISQNHLYDKIIVNQELTQSVDQLNNVILTVLAKGASS